MITNDQYEFVMRRDFVTFLERAFYELNPKARLIMAPFLQLMAAHLENCRQGSIRRLIINLPPRHLKSHTASIAFVAWLLGHQPSTNVICVSYGQDLADKLALDCRKIFQSAWYQRLFVTRLAPDKQAVNDFMTTDNGGRMATSVGGVLTGRGGDFLILDDPLKPEDALSETRRQACNDWYDSTLLSRLNNQESGCIIVIMQRLHQDDLVGHILEKDINSKEPWTVLSFPAIAEVSEHVEFEGALGPVVYSRAEGQALHPERLSLESLKAIQTRVGEYNFSCQYQQAPIPQGGSMVKAHWLMTYDELPSSLEIRYKLQSWDTAIKTKDINDYSVCTSWIVDKQGRYYLVNVLRKRLEYPDLKKAVIEAAREFRPNKILIEDKASGSQLIQDLKRDGILGVTAYEPSVQGDKTMRLYAATALLEAGKVFIPKQAHWLNEYRLELLGFPGSKHDDQVDSTTQALDYLHNRHGSNLAVWEKLGRM